MPTHAPFSLLASVALTFLAACASVGSHASTDSFDADGVHVRHIRVRVAPSHKDDFMSMMRRCVEAAGKDGRASDDEWLCYHEPPARYWIITFSDERGGFTVPPSKYPLRAFAQQMVGSKGPAVRAEIDARFAELEYDVDWVLETCLKSSWSTVSSMSTATHPMARLELSEVRPGFESEFDRTLSQVSAFFVERGFALPIEGFVVYSGAPGTAMQVTFPCDWSSFHGRDSVSRFAASLSVSDREHFERLEADLDRTLRSVETFDAVHVPEASYGGI